MPSWFDAEVRQLEKRTRDRRGSEGLVLFYGSSSFTLWHDMEQSFPAYNVVNHGFGGSTLGDCVEYFDRLVAPMAPKAIIVYAGDNDLDNGSSPETVLGHLETMIDMKRRALGAVPMAFVSIKISIARLHFMHKIGWTNYIIEKRLADEPDVRFIDVTRRMIGRGLYALTTYFSHDPLHMNHNGYGIWTRTIGDHLDSVDDGSKTLRVRPDAADPVSSIVLWPETLEREKAA